MMSTLSPSLCRLGLWLSVYEGRGGGEVHSECRQGLRCCWILSLGISFHYHHHVYTTPCDKPCSLSKTNTGNSLTQGTNNSACLAFLYMPCMRVFAVFLSKPKHSTYIRTHNVHSSPICKLKNEAQMVFF